MLLIRACHRIANQAICYLIMTTCFIAACAPTLSGIGRESFVSGVARIHVGQVHRSIITVYVKNLSPGFLLIDRDGFRLQTSRGEVERVPGGAASIYSVLPSGIREVRLKYDLAGVSSGERVMMTLRGAVSTEAGWVAMPPIPLRAE